MASSASHDVCRAFLTRLRELASLGPYSASSEAIAQLLKDEGLGRCSVSSLRRLQQGAGGPPTGPESVLRKALRILAGGQHGDAVEELVRLRAAAAEAFDSGQRLRAAPASRRARGATRYVALPDEAAPASIAFVDDLLSRVAMATGERPSARNLARWGKIGSGQARAVVNGEAVLPPDAFQRVIGKMAPGDSEATSDIEGLTRRYVEQYARLLQEEPTLARLHRVVQGTSMSSSSAHPYLRDDELDPLTRLRHFLGSDQELLWATAKPTAAEIPAWGMAHAPTGIPYSLDEAGELPYFVRRDRQQVLCNLLRYSNEQRRIVLLSGPASVGKTRLLFETIYEVLPEGPVLVPTDGAQVNRLAYVDFRLPEMILWLDEIQRFLPGPYAPLSGDCVTKGALATLLKKHRSVTMVGTILNEHYNTFMGPGLVAMPTLLKESASYKATVPLYL
ncbi:MAG: hypothetical protein AB7V44_02370 [Pseudonocardia sp.]